MDNYSMPHAKKLGWLDRFAIGATILCAVHCLLTPFLIVALPLIATSFFVHEDFHLWMLLMIVPTTGLAMFMGLRKHKDKLVASLSGLGLSILIFALVQERAKVGEGVSVVDSGCSVECASCSRDIAKEPIPMHAGAWINTFGGLLIAGAHFRNFRLCRRRDCCDHDGSVAHSLQTP